MNPGYFSLAATTLEPQQKPCFYIFLLEYGALMISQTSEQKNFVLKPR